MSLELFAEHEARDRDAVYTDTWAHLAPEYEKEYHGWMVFTQSEGFAITIDFDFGDLCGSPWQNQAFEDFIFELESQNIIESGHVYRLDGFYQMTTEDALGYCFKGKITEIEVVPSRKISKPQNINFKEKNTNE